MTTNNQKLLCNTIDGKLFVDIAKIQIIEANGNHSYVIHEKEKQFVTESLKKLESTLLNYGFCRIHRRYLVNMIYIKKIVTKGACHVLLRNESEGQSSKNQVSYPVSANGKAGLIEAMMKMSVGDN